MQHCINSCRGGGGAQTTHTVNNSTHASIIRDTISYLGYGIYVDTKRMTLVCAIVRDKCIYIVIFLR